MARRYDKSQKKEDILSLEAQREEKRLKQEMIEKKNLQKASKEHIETLFLYEKWIDGKCWTSPQEVEDGLDEMRTKGGKLEMLKLNINIYVKGLGLEEYKIAMTTKTFEELKSHLLYIIEDSVDKEKMAPTINIPKMKEMPALGELTEDARIAKEESIDQVLTMERESVQMRNDLIVRGERDEIKLHQPTEAPNLLPGLKLQICCNYFDHETGIDQLEWCDGTVIQVSNGKNLRNDEGKFLRKDAGAMIRWNENDERDEEVSESCVTLLKKNFNKKEEGGWRLFFNVSLTDVDAYATRLQSVLEEEHYAIDVDAISSVCKYFLIYFFKLFHYFLHLIYHMNYTER